MNAAGNPADEIDTTLFPPLGFMLIDATHFRITDSEPRPREAIGMSFSAAW